jgi:phage pi2 protein 07
MHPKPAKRLHRSWESQRARHGQKKGHIITVRNRAKSLNGGVEGWFFYPTVREEEWTLIAAYNQELHDLIQRNLPKLRVGGH